MPTSLPRPLDVRADGPDGHLAIHLRDHLDGSAGGPALMARSRSHVHLVEEHRRRAAVEAFVPART